MDRQVVNPDIPSAVERSSLGTPDAVAARASVTDDVAARVVARARDVAAEDGTDPLLEAVRWALGEVLWNASNYPERAQPFMLGQDTSPLRDKCTAAVMAVVRAADGATRERIIHGISALLVEPSDHNYRRGVRDARAIARGESRG